MQTSSPYRSRRLSSFGSAILLATLACREDVSGPSGPALEAGGLVDQALVQVAFQQVSTGGYHTCGTATNGRAYCWGWNQFGQVGDGTTTNRLAPKPVAGGLRFRHVSVGDNHSCGVTTDDRVFCWGRNERGQLGDGTTADRLTPGAVAGNRRFRQIRAGTVHTCALTSTHVAFCWGENADGRLGDGTNLRRLMPARVLGDHQWRQLSAGGGHTCGVTMDDYAYCWGADGSGQLGNGGQNIDLLSPAAVTGGLRIRQIEAGENHTCGVTTSDQAFCWGYGGAGNLGDGTQLLSRPVPFPVAGNRRFRHVNAGLSHTCGVTASGRGLCWGGNGSGQVGDGTTEIRTRPRALGIDLQLDQVSAGGFHTCGVTEGGQVYCWGNNIRGQIGDGTADPSGAAHPLPILIAAP